jgi:hypothetical protein
MNSHCLAVDYKFATTQEDYEEKLAKIEVQKIGKPTMKSFEALRKDLQQVITRKLNTTLFPEGTTYGHMKLICEEDEYGSYIGNKNYAYSDPVPPEDYEVAITDTMTEVQRRAKEEELRRYQIEYNKYMATIKALCNAIAEAVNSEYIKKLGSKFRRNSSSGPFPGIFGPGVAGIIF